MRKLSLFGIILLFLISVVSAIILDISGNTTVNENEKLTLILTATEINGTAEFHKNVTFGQITTLNSSSAKFEWTPGFDVVNLSNPSKNFVILFWVNDTGNNLSDEQPVTITVNNVNRVPIASAGSDQTVDVNSTVTLDGSGSSDPDNDPITYAWVQHSGPESVTLSNLSAQKPTFKPTKSGDYLFNLTVSDTANQSTDQVKITVRQPVKLKFEDFDVKVGSKSDNNIEDEDNYRLEDAEPEDEIVFKVEVRNLYEDDIDINDVSMKVTIEGIDDGDDLDDETDEEDIASDDTEKFELRFEVPLKVDEDDYDVLVEIEGKDELGNTQKITKNLILPVDKPSHDVRIIKADLKNPTVSCNRNTNLLIDVLNMGSESEEEVRITASNAELDLDFEKFDDGDIELDTGASDDAQYLVNVPIDAKDVDPGSYTIDVNVYRDETKLEDTKIAILTVAECTEKVPPKEEEKEEEKKEEVEVTVGKPDTTLPQGQFPVIAQVQEEGFTQSTAYFVLLTLAAVVLILLVIWILVLLVKRK